MTGNNVTYTYGTSGTYMVKIRTTSGTTLRKLTVKGE